MSAFAALLSTAAALCFYLASPHQTWRAQAWPPRLRWLGAALLVAAQAAWLVALQPLAAAFTALTLQMLLLGALPLLGALRGAPAHPRHRGDD